MDKLIKLSENKGVIYKFTSPSSKIYIGQSICFKNRLRQYKNKHNKSIGKFLKAAIDKYGFENCIIEIIETIDFKSNIEDTKKELDLLETKWINYYDCIAPKGYNLTGGGKGSFKRVITKETRIKLSKSSGGTGILEDVDCYCGFCNQHFRRKPSKVKRDLKNSKSNLIFCSLSCVRKLAHKNKNSEMEKLVFSEVSYASDTGSSPVLASKNKIVSFRNYIKIDEDQKEIKYNFLSDRI